MAPGAGERSRIDTSVAHSARVHDYWLGGKDNLAADRAAARTLDFSRPVAIMLIAVMHLIVDADDPCGIVGRLTAALPPGSYLALPPVRVVR